MHGKILKCVSFELHKANQQTEVGVFKPLSYCFEETVGF